MKVRFGRQRDIGDSRTIFVAVPHAYRELIKRVLWESSNSDELPSDVARLKDLPRSLTCPQTADDEHRYEGRQMEKILLSHAAGVVRPTHARTDQPRSERRSQIRRRMVAGALAVSTHLAFPGAIDAEVLRDPVGTYLGCDQDPEDNPYCTAPELRALFQEQRLLGKELQQLPKVEISDGMGLSAAGTLPGWMIPQQVHNALAIDMRRCNADKACLISEMEERAKALRVAAGKPADMPLVSPDAVATLEAGQEAEEDRLRQAARDIGEAYSVEWEKARALLAPPDDPDFVEPLFLWRNPAPETWASKRDGRCRDDLACLADRADIDRLVAVQRDAEWRRAEATALAEKRAREDRVAEIARAEAERRREEQRATYIASLGAYDIDRILPEGSHLRPVLFGDLDLFDESTALPFAREIAGGFGSAATLFVGEGMGASVSRGIMENRRNLVLAAYGLTRREVLGYCGDRKVEVYRRTTPGSEVRTLGGATLQRFEGVEVYTGVPAPFARFVKASHFERGVDLFRTEILRLAASSRGDRIPRNR